MKYFSFALSLLIVAFVAGCSMEGSQRVTVVDENDLLLSKNPDQKEIKKTFNASYVEGDIKLDLDTDDMTLLKSIR